MHLMDCVAQAPRDVLIDDTLTGRRLALPGAGTYRDRVASTPVRYVLDDAVTAACADMVASRQAFLADTLDIVRIPLQEFWIEWNEAIRTGLFAGSDQSGRDTTGGRAGMLVQMDASGRAGILRVFWSLDGRLADMSPAVLRFALDRPDITRNADIAVRAQDTALQTVFDRLHIDLDQDWSAYYRRRAQSRVQLDTVVSDTIGPAAFDFPFLLSFALLLMAGSHQTEATDLSTINRARRRRGRPELLGHLRVTQQVFQTSEARRCELSASDRASPRLHLVRGHLVRRGDKVFWRTSHFRGRVSDTPLRKTIHLVMGDAGDGHCRQSQRLRRCAQ